MNLPVAGAAATFVAVNDASHNGLGTLNASAWQ